MGPIGLIGLIGLMGLMGLIRLIRLIRLMGLIVYNVVGGLQTRLIYFGQSLRLRPRR